MIKIHKTSPLPFQGQKRNFVKQFTIALKDYPSDATYIDLFGGSGLLSHTVKSVYPDAKVIYNDYDNFKQRISAIPETNKILKELRLLLDDHPRGERITGIHHKVLLKLIKTADKKGFVDYITISSSILFSMNYVKNYQELEKQTFYNRIRKADYQANGYLTGVDVVCDEYKNIFNKYKNKDNVVFLVDPPYLSTDNTTYKNYWKLADYLDVLKVLTNTNYFYFTSNKSSIIELCEWIEDNTGGVNPFNQAKIVRQKTRTTGTSGYTDIMLHKQWASNNTLDCDISYEIK